MGDVNPNRLALLSDIHIDADRKHEQKTGVNMWDHFHRCSEEIIALKSRPAMALVNGDCAYLHGRPEDYATVVNALKPLREAGFPLHLALGNHDSRENLKAAVAQDKQSISELPDRRVMRLELPAADWYMLDSLNKTASTAGVLGDEQIAWLKKSLDARANRPAVVMLHHQPDERDPDKVSGLKDTRPFLDVVEPRKHVKAVLFGHTHVWKHYVKDGLHFINLPTTAYVFDPKQPAGWVDANLLADSMKLQLHAITPNHPLDKEVLDLKWR